MEHTRSGSDILVRLDPGEEIHTSLKKLADDLGFDALPSLVVLGGLVRISMAT